MKRSLSKSEAQQTINEFFTRDDFTVEELRKILRIAMKYRIRLGKLRQKYCKHCLHPLQGKIRISGTHRTICCTQCGRVTRHQL